MAEVIHKMEFPWTLWTSSTLLFDSYCPSNQSYSDRSESTPSINALRLDVVSISTALPPEYFMLLYLNSVDPTLGRLDYNSLSQQALMEMVIGQLSAPYQNAFKDDAGNFLDIEHWYGVAMYSDNVEEISWTFPFEEDYKRENHGRICLEWLPDTVRIFTIDNNYICGVLTCSKLPRSLRQLYAQNNRFAGKLDLPGL